jgi:hypothetical protein
LWRVVWHRRLMRTVCFEFLFFGFVDAARFDFFALAWAYVPLDLIRSVCNEALWR